MLMPILLILVGIAIAGAGLYYRGQNTDAESRKIYGITAVVGVVVAVAGAALLLL